MELFRPIINQRIALLNNSASKENIEDVIFSIKVIDDKIFNIDIFLTPYIGLLNPTDKEIAAKKVLNKLLDRSYFFENNIEFHNKNTILFFSYDPQNFNDKCFTIDLNTNKVILQNFSLNGDIILDQENTNQIDIFQIKNDNIEKSSIFLFFDTETTGLPKNYKAPESNLSNWPRMIQLAYLLYDQKKGIISKGNYIIKPIGFEIPPDSSKIHGITKDIALSKGTDLNEVLDVFKNMLDKADYLVAHNIEFDKKILGAEFLRNKSYNPISSKKMICTMESTTKYCAIEGRYGYKWPSLKELHFKLFNEYFEDAHDALVDVLITYKCFIELQKNNIIKLNK
jgi:DNA polymerase III epsilon subunit-like protein